MAADYLPMIPADKYPYMNLLSHHVAEGRYDSLHEFEFGLEIFLAGLDRF